MPKAQLKEKVSKKQNGKCALTGETLPTETMLVDTDRITSKRNGGTYHEANTRVVDPLAHMERHGNLRIRDDQLEELKAVIDDRKQVGKLTYKIQNQLRAYMRRTDNLHERTVEWLKAEKERVEKDLRDRDKILDGLMKEIAESDALAKTALGVPAIGPVTVGHCMAYIDLEKANHASSLWKYAGLHAASHERYVKGETSGGNKTLRTALFNMAMTQIRSKGPYRVEYDRTKAKLAVSEKMVKTRDTKGNLVERAWKDTKPSHRHGAALRAIMKHFLADYWFVGRTLLGLPTDPIYPVAILGHSRMIMPEERGWVY